jgi:glycine/D-amino acid oxidase-like deaminating enzyme
MERMLNASFLHEKAIYRPFGSAEEQNEWMGKSAGEEFGSYVSEVFLKETLDHVKDHYGGIMLTQSGYLDIPVYLQAMKAYLSERQIIKKDTIEPEDLSFEESGVVFRETRYKKIIFCDGTFGGVNTFFDWLPFRPVKGELLEVSLDMSFPVIVNRGVFMLETMPGIFRVGSTYNNHELSWEPTTKGKEYLLEKLGKLIDGTPVVKRHYAGVRPATADRHPILGFHPGNETIGLFNGLGTKGVSLSPWFGEHFSGHLCGDHELDDEVNINRYFSLY